MEAKAVTAAGAGVERRRVARDLDAIAPRLGAKHIDRRAVIGGKMHAQQRGLRPLPDCQHVMLAAGGAEVDAVALGANRFEGPHLGVELRRLMKIANAELDAADAGNPAVCHGRDLVPSPGSTISHSPKQRARAGRTDSVERNADQSCASRGITSLANNSSERSASSSVIVPRNR